jgi:hypothetical protein
MGKGEVGVMGQVEQPGYLLVADTHKLCKFGAELGLPGQEIVQHCEHHFWKPEWTYFRCSSAFDY